MVLHNGEHLIQQNLTSLKLGTRLPFWAHHITLGPKPVAHPLAFELS